MHIVYPRIEWTKVKSESEVAQLCPTLCDPMDCSPPGSSVDEILQVRILEWVAITFSRGIFPTQGLNLEFPTLQADSLPSEPPGSLSWSFITTVTFGKCYSLLLI